MAYNQQDPLVKLSGSSQNLISTRYRWQHVVSNVQTDFLRGMKAMRNGKRRFCEGWRGSSTMFNGRTARRGGFYVICVDWHGFWDIHPQQRSTEKKKRAQGIPCHSWSTATGSAAVGRVIYAALRVARRHLSPSRGRWQPLCLPTARGSARKKDWNPDVGSSLVALVFWISTRKHERVTVNILCSSDKHVPVRKPYGDSELQLDRVFTEVGTSFQQNPSS